jgi:hypothetical protein
MTNEAVRHWTLVIGDSFVIGASSFVIQYQVLEADQVFVRYTLISFTS